MDIVVSPPETRARSRSKTPLTQTAAEEEGKRRKSPNLQPIVETDSEATPKVNPTRHSSSQKQSNDSANKVTVQQNNSSVTTTVQTTSTTVTTRKSGNANNSNSDKKNSSASKEQKESENRRTKEVKQNEINEKIAKKTITSTPKQAANQSVTFKMNSSHEDIDLNQHPAYKEYIEAGEFWNKFPKTDYTYSELSPHRRELAPGFIAMPNMSRKSMDRHVERVNTMIQNNPDQASFIRQRYQWNPRMAARNAANKSFSFFSRNLLSYDSQDEVDLSEFDRNRRRVVVHKEFFLKRVVITVWTWITSLFQRMTSVFRRRTSTTYVTRQQFTTTTTTTSLTDQQVEQESFFRRIGTFFKETILSVFRRFYLLLATILFFDTWLLHRRTATVDQIGQDVVVDGEIVEKMPKTKKRFLWTIALLLPFLLLAGWYWLCPSGPPLTMLAPVLSEELSVTEALAYVKEKLVQQSAILASSTMGLISLVPSFNWGKGESSVQHQATVNSFTYNDEAIRRDLKDFVVNLMAQQKQEIIQNTNNYYLQYGAEHEGRIRELIEKVVAEKAADFQKRNLTPEEITDILNVLMAKLRSENYPGFQLTTEENLRKIFLDMRQRFVDDNDIFLSKILNDPQFNIYIANKFDTTHLEHKIEELVVEFNRLKAENGDLKLGQNTMKGSLNQDEKLELMKQSLMLLVNEMIKERVKEVVEVMVVKEKHASGSTPSQEAETPDVLLMINKALRVYDADKTGLADYALESAGGQVLSTRCTENYHVKSAQLLIFGIPLWFYPSNTPRTAIQPYVQPGNCWAFQGFPGFLVLQLNMEIYVSGFTLEHIPKSLSNGRIDSAPKAFSVWGLTNENDQEPTNFGVYEFSDDDEASSYQFFPVQQTGIDQKFHIVELRIESNHGQPNYTCLYRFRVHGSPIRNSYL